MLKFNAILLTAASIALVGCSTMPYSSNVDKTSATSKYSVDWEYVNKIERANSGSALPGRIIWANPPMKEVGTED